VNRRLLWACGLFTASTIVYTSCRSSNPGGYRELPRSVSASPPSVPQAPDGSGVVAPLTDSANTPNSIYAVDGDVAYIPAGSDDANGRPLLGEDAAESAIFALPEVKEIASGGPIQLQAYCYPKQGCSACWWCFMVLAVTPAPIATGYRFQVDARTGAVFVAEPAMDPLQEEAVPYERWHQALDKLRRASRPSGSHEHPNAGDGGPSNRRSPEDLKH
jgi:hypothetical protein